MLRLALALSLPLGSLAAQTLHQVVAGDPNTTVSSMSSWRRSVVAAPSGLMWALVRASDATAGGQVYLTGSADGGRTWAGRYDTATSNDSGGAIAIGRNCETLHVAWNALDTNGLHNVYYQAFNALTQTWVGQPQQLTGATSSNDQYYCSDIAVAANGTLVIAITTHRSPQGSWTSGWASGIYVRSAGATTFDPVRQVNTDTYGQRIDLQAVENVVHAAFRTNTGLYGTRYRAFDCEAMRFTTSGDVQVATGTSNVSTIAADSDGNLYVAYASGGSSGGTGEIRVAYAPANNPTSWTSLLVAADPDLVKGNVADVHYSLASTGTGLVAVFYSKKTTEQHHTLYYRLMTAGAFVTPETTAVATTDAGRFRVVSGVRNPEVLSNPMCLVGSRATIHVGNRVDLLELQPSGRAIEFGIGCRGTLPEVPRLRAVTSPDGGTTYRVELNRAPANRPAAFLFSTGCAFPAVDLTPFGMPSCRLELLNPDAGAFTTGAGGDAVFAFPLPSNAPYAGLAILFQTVVLAPGANATGAVLSNGLSTVVR